MPVPPIATARHFARGKPFFSEKHSAVHRKCLSGGATHLHAYIDGRPTNRLRKSCGSAEPYRQEKLRARALHHENERGGPMLPPGCCSRFVWPTWSTSLLAHAPIVVCSRGSQQKYCVALSEKSWCDSSVCDEYMLFSLAKWLGIHLTRGHGPSSDQSALLGALYR